MIRSSRCNISRLLFCVCATLFALLATTARGENAIAFDTTRFWGKAGGVGVFGWQFTARSNMLVSALGLYDDPSSYDGGFPNDGFLEPHTIAIWAVSSPDTPLTSATLPSGRSGWLQNGFRYVDVAPVTLYAGYDYVIAATYQAEDGVTGEYNNQEFNLTNSLAIELGGYRYWNPGPNVLEFPQGYEPGVEFAYGPNFSFTVIPGILLPEPVGTNMIFWQHDDGRVASWRFNGTNFQQATPLFQYFDSTSWRLIGVNDFDRDEQPEFLWHKSNESVLYTRWTESNEMEKLRLQWRGPHPHTWRLVGFGDFNGDTHKDMLWQNKDQQFEIWYMNEIRITGYSLLMSGQPVAPGWRAMGLHDFNDDTYTDILWQHDNGTVAVSTMHGTDAEMTLLIRVAGNGWRIGGVSDFTKDGHKDILLRNKDGRMAVWMMRGTAYVRAIPLRRGSPRAAGWRIVGVQ